MWSEPRMQLSTRFKLFQVATRQEEWCDGARWSARLTNTIPIAVIIPTYNRGLAVISVLNKIQECDPKPVEIWIHIDLSDGRLEDELAKRFPDIRILTSSIRLGPGGGRHRCLLACTTPYAVSFDDDSYPGKF